MNPVRLILRVGALTLVDLDLWRRDDPPGDVQDLSTGHDIGGTTGVGFTADLGGDR